MKKLKLSAKAVLIGCAMLVAVVFSGCTDPEETNSSERFDNRRFINYVAYGKKIQVVEIDSCEYLYSYNFNATWMTHKGNCKFCAERSKKQSINTNNNE